MPHIESPNNPLVKQLKSLAEAKGRRSSGLFLVEGVRGVEDGIKSGAHPSLCIMNEELLVRTERGSNLLAMLKRTGIANLHTVSERVLRAASQTEQPQGIVAAFPVRAWETHAQPAETPLVLICDAIRDPGNMGTILRSAEASGVDAVWAAEGCVDLYNPKVVRAAMGAHFRLPMFGNLSWSEIRERLPSMSLLPDHVYCTEAEASRSYDAVDWTKGCALVISNEAHGISTEARELCSPDSSIRIPMAGGTESLNAAVAASVILFEAARQRRAVSAKEPIGESEAN